MLTKKQKDLLQQVIVGGIGGAAGGMLLKYDMKTLVVIGAVAYLAYSSVFSKKDGRSLGTQNNLHRNQ